MTNSETHEIFLRMTGVWPETIQLWTESRRFASRFAESEGYEFVSPLKFASYLASKGWTVTDFSRAIT